MTENAIDRDVDSRPCAACGHLDGTDGATDGTFGVGTSVVRSEHGMRTALRRLENRTADQITEFAGSMRFVYIHIIWFGVWVALNVGLAGLGWEFDRFPFGLLTMLVSLEAIFLATFVMISQNRQAARTELRADLDFENNLRAELWAIHIGHRLGIDPDHVESTIRVALEQSRARLEAGAS